MHFDWKTFLDRHGVHYVERGPNVARNHVGINCPFCASDSGEHMGLSLDTKRPAWGCWRDKSHRGVNPIRLIVALLGCSTSYAESLVRQASAPELDAFEKAAASLRGEPMEATEAATTTKHQEALPAEFKKMTPQGTYGQLFLRYLLGRGFNGVHRFAKHYDLRYCLTGSFKWRMIIPIYYHGELVSWTGRDITGHADLRYKTLSDDTGAAKTQGYLPARQNIKTTVYNRDKAEAGGKVLCVVEGPMDVLRLDWYLDDPEIVVAGCFGKPDESQVLLLSRLARKFDRVVSLLDNDAQAQAVALVDQLQELSGRPARWVPLPYGVKDPGELDTDLIKKFGQTF